jgi:hypothetical protein
MKNVRMVGSDHMDFGSLKKWIDVYFRDNSPRRGYVYVQGNDAGVMTQARRGARVKIARREPPWIVVYHDFADVTVARWPGRLWQVDIIDPITADDLAAAKAVSLRADVGFTRAAAVKVLKEVPTAALFGAHGAKVCAVIDIASALTLECATRLAATRHAQAGEAQTRIWRAWLAGQPPQSSRYDGSYDGVLGISSRAVSPLGAALTLISTQVGRRAEAVVGDSVWSDDPDDPEVACLALPWSRAMFPLFDAALAVGVPEFVSDADRLILLDAWRREFDHDPD